MVTLDKYFCVIKSVWFVFWLRSFCFAVQFFSFWSFRLRSVVFHCVFGVVTVV